MSYVFLIGVDEICMDCWAYFWFVAKNKKTFEKLELTILLRF